MAVALRPLIEAARRGDRQALNSLAGCVDRFVRIHSGSLSSHLRRTHGSTVDFVLEGLAEALARVASFDYQSDEQFYAWVSHYIRGRIVDAARHEQAARRAGRPLPLREDGEEQAAPGVTPSAILSREELNGELIRTLLELQVEHPREMEVIVQKLFEGQTWSEICSRFELGSEKKARVLFARGLDLLRPRVKERLGAEAVRDLLGLPRSTSCRKPMPGGRA